MDLGRVISNLLSLGKELLPAIITSAQAPSISSASPAVDQNQKIEAELKKLITTLEWIKATLYDAKQRENRNFSVQPWLTELERVAYDAHEVLNEYHHVLLQKRDSRKRKLIEVPYSMLDQIKQIRSRIDEIANDPIALQLSEGDGPKRCNNELQIVPTSHLVVESDIFGREREKEKLIHLLSTERDVFSVEAMSAEQLRIWSDHYVSGGVENKKDQMLVEIGQKTVNKCGILSEGNGPERCNNEMGLSFVYQSNIIGRETEKEKLIDFFDTERDVEKPFDFFATERDVFSVEAMSAEQLRIWADHYVSGGVENKKDQMLVEIGQKTVNKCGILSEGNGPERCNDEMGLRFVYQSNIIGRETEKEKLIDFFDTERDVEKLIDFFDTERGVEKLIDFFDTERDFEKLIDFFATERDVLSAEHLWIRPDHFVSGGVENNKDEMLVEIGQKTVNNCGTLPLVVKSNDYLLSNLLEEELWRENLECESRDMLSPNKKVKRMIDKWNRGKQLGGGSFGIVYEAISDEGFFFAVKEVLIHEGNHATKLEQEITLLSQFEHENIVQYYGAHREETKLNIFLELMTQGSIRSLYQNYPLQDTLVSEYTRQIIYGLVYLHEKNIVHRDIKCANILVHANGSVKIADFGLAKMITSNNILSFQGSVHWMAPEVVNPKGAYEAYKLKTYGLEADIWSLGCTVLEMLTRKIPYPDLECQQAVFNIGRGEQPLIPSNLSIQAQDFIKQCIRVNPAERPSAVQLLEHPFVKIPPASQS